MRTTFYASTIYHFLLSRVKYDILTVRQRRIYCVVIKGALLTSLVSDLRCILLFFFC